MKLRNFLSLSSKKTAPDDTSSSSMMMKKQNNTKKNITARGVSPQHTTENEAQQFDSNNRTLNKPTNYIIIPPTADNNNHYNVFEDHEMITNNPTFQMICQKKRFLVKDEFGQIIFRFQKKSLKVVHKSKNCISMRCWKKCWYHFVWLENGGWIVQQQDREIIARMSNGRKNVTISSSGDHGLILALLVIADEIAAK